VRQGPLAKGRGDSSPCSLACQSDCRSGSCG
jgi:hypothetical protein